MLSIGKSAVRYLSLRKQACAWIAIVRTHRKWRSFWTSTQAWSGFRMRASLLRRTTRSRRSICATRVASRKGCLRSTLGTNRGGHVARHAWVEQIHYGGCRGLNNASVSFCMELEYRYSSGTSERHNDNPGLPEVPKYSSIEF